MTDKKPYADAKSFGERLKQLREEQDKTAYDLAADAEVERTSYTKLEHGAMSPSADTLLRLAKALNVKPEYLLWGEE